MTAYAVIHQTLRTKTMFSQRRKRLLTFTALGIAISVAACSDGGSPTEPKNLVPVIVPGFLSLTVEGVRSDDRAILFKISGLASSSGVEVKQSKLTMHARPVGEALSIALFGEAAQGELATIAIPNIAAPPTYTVTLVEIANKAGALRPDSALATYKLSIRPR